MKNVGKTIKDYSLYLGVFFLALGFTSCSDDDDGDVLEPDPTGSITVEDQTVTNNSITVNNVDADEDAWLVLRRGSATGDQLADPVFITEGTQNNVTINLNQDVTLEDGETLFLVLHEDDGDDEWIEGDDLPFTDPDGGNVVASFTVSMDGEEPGNGETAINVGDTQVISQNRIRVESINVSEDSWLVARNAGSEGEADIVSDPVHISADETNEDVVLTLNENATLTGNEAGDDIVLMLHQDTGEAGAWEYDGESDLDQPLMNENDEPVTRTVNVTGPSLSADNDQVVTENNEVTFSSVNTANSGWIALYGDDGEGNVDYENPIGQGYVEAGENQDVLVPFNEGYEYSAGQTIYPRLYMDDPADENFTYYSSEGAEDMPEMYGYDTTTGEGRYVGNTADTNADGGFTLQ